MMRRIFVAAMALTVLAAQPAAAQFYPGPYGGGGYDRYEDDEDYDYAPRRGYRRDYYERDYGPPRSYRSRRAQLGSVCVTARGNCDAGMVAPRNTPCRCFIPGFGPKRGAIGY